MIQIDGPIDNGTRARVADALAKTRGRVTVALNSPGGSVTAGLAIYDALAAHPGGVETRASGVVASMASVLFMVGKVRRIDRNAFLMIHNPWTITQGDAAEHRQTADLLEKVGGKLVAIYADRTGRPADEIKAMMDKETWLDAEESVAMGFADEIASAPRAEIQPASQGAPAVAWTPAMDAALLENAILEIHRLEAAVAQEQTKVALLETLCGVRGIDPEKAVSPAIFETGQLPGEGHAAFVARQFEDMPPGPERVAFFEKHREILFAHRNRTATATR